jgi:hypothetical protein
MRRDERDRRPPGRVITSLILGDPPADYLERRAAAERRGATGETMISMKGPRRRGYERKYT